MPLLPPILAHTHCLSKFASTLAFNSAVSVSPPLSTVPFVLLCPDPFSVLMLALPRALTMYTKKDLILIRKRKRWYESGFEGGELNPTNNYVVFQRYVKSLRKEKIKTNIPNDFKPGLVEVLRTTSLGLNVDRAPNSHPDIIITRGEASM